MVQNVSEKNWQSAVAKLSGLAVVDFWAPWCPICVSLLTVFEDLAQELSEKAHFFTLNAQENIALAQSCGIYSVPSFLFLKDGQEQARAVGVQTRSELKSFTYKYLEISAAS